MKQARTVDVMKKFGGSDFGARQSLKEEGDWNTFHPVTDMYHWSDVRKLIYVPIMSLLPSITILLMFSRTLMARP